MFTLTTVTCWLVALGGLALAAAHLATTGLDPAAGLLMTAGMAALVIGAQSLRAGWSARRRLRGRLHNLAMIRLLRPRVT